MEEIIRWLIIAIIVVALVFLLVKLILTLAITPIGFGYTYDNERQILQTLLLTPRL